MVVKKSNIISIALLLTIAATPIIGFADGGNNLVQLDLKRTSNKGVDVTLFTTNNYNDNVLVRKKSDNKYVLLIPKVQSSGFSSSSLNGVKDLVSNVDVKTVNDTNGGYTKVTLITTKPLDIKTHMQKSAPVTAEQKEYNTLIAQANAVKNNISPNHESHTKVQKTEVTVNKAQISSSNTQIKAKEDKNTKQNSIKNNNKVKENQPKVAPKIELTEIQPQPSDDRQVRRQHLAELINEVKQEKIVEQVPKTEPQEVKNVDINISEHIPDINTLENTSKVSLLSKIKSHLKGNTHIPKKIKFAFLGLLCLIVLKKLFGAKNTVKGEQKPFIYDLEQDNNSLGKAKYNHIVNNNELNWQQKYQMYLDKSAKPVARGNKKGNYTFIKTPAEPTEVTLKRKELENLLNEMPDRLDIEPEIIEVQSEDEKIQKAIKFKAFDRHTNSLRMTDRNKLKSRFKKYEVEVPLHEQKNIKLGDSALHTNPRRLKDANLDIADVDKKRLKYKPQEYIMSSLDEYFSILDKEKQTETNPADKAIKFDLPKTKVEQTSQPVISQTNPIKTMRDNNKSSYLNGLIIKSGFNIDNQKGFYIVNLDGKSALIGKVNDEVFVLKIFDKNVTNPIQVRHDNANVYMVKAGDFKSLVEVDKDKMGVLIEL